jgi:hypothetical protein
MTSMRNAPRISIALTLVLALGAFAFSAPALASSASEPQQGAQVLSEVQAGKLNAASLSSSQYQRVGQYLMGRALGSTQSYEEMDTAMDRMMGEAASDQMYLYLGERYLGRNVQPDSRYAPYYGWMGSMMSAYRGSSPYAGMMGAYLSGQGNGTTSNPTATHPIGPGMMGYGYGTTAASGGWPTAAVLAVAALGAALLGAGLALALPRLRSRRGRPSTPAPGYT